MQNLKNKYVNKIYQKIFCQQYSYISITQIRNRFIEIKQYLQLIKKLLKSNSISYIVENSKKHNRENRFLYKQNNLSSAINNANNFIILITKTIVTIQTKDSINNNQRNRDNCQIFVKKKYIVFINYKYYIYN